MKLHRLFVLLIVGILTSSSFAAVWNVNVSGTSFTPQHITIQQCDTVIWQNTGGFHNVRETGSDLFVSGAPASAPWAYQFVFENVTPGLYNYQCDVHFSVGMTGTVTVLASDPQLHLVNVSGTSFTPQHLTITQGDTVRWQNTGGFHNVRETGSSLFNSGSAASAPWAYTFVFNNVAAGVYNYRCDVHFSVGMTGTVTVEQDICPVVFIPDPPTELTVRRSGNDAVLDWEPVTGATSYSILSSTDATDDPFATEIGTSPTNTFTHSNAFASDTIRFYQVRALAE